MSGEAMRFSRRSVIGLVALVVVMAIAATVWAFARGPTSAPEPAPTETFAERPFIHESSSEPRASTLESVLTVGALVAVLGGCLTAITWAQRRRARGEEASTYNAEGGEAGAGLGSMWGGGGG